MSFWKFGFAPAPSSIESLLISFAAPPSSSSAAVASDLSARTLDQLLACPDLLSEVKSGSNSRLLDFLARAEVVQRLGGWIVWGLGGDAVEEVLNGGIVTDDVEDGPVPEINVALGKGKTSGMGGVPRRMNLNALGEFEGDEVEQSLERTSAPYVNLYRCQVPRLKLRLQVSASGSRGSGIRLTESRRYALRSSSFIVAAPFPDIVSHSILVSHVVATTRLPC